MSKVVDGMQSLPNAATLETADGALEITADELEAPVEASELAEASVAPPRVDAATFVPAASTAVKLEKPCAIMTWATLNPVASNGVVMLVAELAFSTSCPPTAGSIRGTTPRSSADLGRVGSEQMEGMEATKGLKFCSAAT